MKTSHKQHIRCLIMELLHDEDIRHRMSSFLDSVEQLTGNNIDTFEAMEFYEQEVERINQMFRYPQQGTEDPGTIGFKTAPTLDTHTKQLAEVER